MLDRPYFMSNADWYEYDFEKGEYVLTDKATDEAKKSYEEYKETIKEAQRIGVIL